MIQEQQVFTDEQKGEYFAGIATAHIGALLLHNEQGLWDPRDPKAGGESDWWNVTEHCLVEAARVSVFADALGLPEDVKIDLADAAAVHDFYKKREVAKLRAEGTTWEAYAGAQEEAKEVLDASSLNKRVVWLATSVGHETLTQAEKLATKPDLTDDEKAWLVMHYVDDYTIDDKWVEPATTKDGSPVNDLTRRMDRNRANAEPGKRYHGINQAGMEHFGEPTYDAQQRVGELIQNRLAQLISASAGTEVTPYDLPTYVDQKLAAQIAQVHTKPSRYN